MRKCLVFGLLLLCYLASAAWSAQTLKLLEDTAVTPGTASLNNIGSNGFTVESAVIANTNNYPRCRVTLVFKWTTTTTPTTGAAAYVWFMQTTDGTNYATSPTSAITTGTPSISIPIPTGTGTNTSRAIGEGYCPPGGFTLKIQLNSTGQTTDTTGNTISVRPYTIQMQ